MFYVNFTLKFEIGTINKVTAEYDNLVLIN